MLVTGTQKMLTGTVCGRTHPPHVATYELVRQRTTHSWTHWPKKYMDRPYLRAKWSYRGHTFIRSLIRIEGISGMEPCILRG